MVLKADEHYNDPNLIREGTTTFDLRHQDHSYQNNLLKTTQHHNPFYLLILLFSRVTVSTPAGLCHCLFSDYIFLFQVNAGRDLSGYKEKIQKILHPENMQTSEWMELDSLEAAEPRPWQSSSQAPLSRRPTYMVSGYPFQTRLFCDSVEQAEHCSHSLLNRAMFFHITLLYLPSPFTSLRLPLSAPITSYSITQLKT